MTAKGPGAAFLPPRGHVRQGRSLVGCVVHFPTVAGVRESPEMGGDRVGPRAQTHLTGRQMLGSPPARHVRCHPGTATWLPGARLQRDGRRGVGFLPGER